MTGDRRGFALVAVLLVLLAVAALTTSMLGAAAREALVTRNAIEAAAARLAAVSALDLARAGWDAQAMSGMTPEEVRQLAWADGSLADGTGHAASAERLDEHRYLLRAVGWTGGAPPPHARTVARAGAIVQALDPDALARRFAVGVESPAGVHLTGTATLTPAPTDSSGCVEPVTSLRAPADQVLIDPGALLTGPVESDGAASLHARFPSGLGFLDVAALHHLADRRTGSTVVPTPSGLPCDTRVTGNWGDPAPGSPCAGFLPLISGSGSLHVAGGTGQGILIVDGDLRLDGGAIFHGLILATGRVEVLDASVTGSVVAGGGLLLQGEIAASACAVRRALLGVAALQRAHPPAGRSRIPLF